MFLKNSSPGWDNFQLNVIKDTFDLLLLPLTHLLNFSITHGVFPDELKIAKVTPILKSGDSAQITKDPSQYCHFVKKSLNVLCMLDYSLLYKNKIYYINISSVSDKVLVQI